MVELLLQRKSQVNCQLNSLRHASLTPLHIACGCLSPNAVDIARQLLEHGAHVNAESFPNNKEYLSLIDPLVIDVNKLVNNFLLTFIKKMIFQFRRKFPNMVVHLYISHVVENQQ